MTAYQWTPAPRLRGSENNYAFSDTLVREKYRERSKEVSIIEFYLLVLAHQT
jgi:hypothetical protein